MNNFMLEVAPDQPLGFTEALGFGGEMVLIGMLTVFSVLALIWIVLSISKYVFSNTKEKKVEDSVQESSPAPVAPVYTASDAEIVAVIAAAIAMAESESGNNLKFRVVSFRRK